MLGATPKSTKWSGSRKAGEQIEALERAALAVPAAPAGWEVFSLLASTRSSSEAPARRSSSICTQGAAGMLLAQMSPARARGCCLSWGPCLGAALGAASLAPSPAERSLVIARCQKMNYMEL